MDSAVVRVQQGDLRGRKVTSKVTSVLGKPFYSFQGIPYAKPPVGPLRFKPPQSADAWQGVREAKSHGSESPQIDISLQKTTYSGEEDCLYLNVYSTEIPTSSAKLEKPVMVFIHGGAFLAGSGNTHMYGADYLMQEDVVLVTINYRLGALGFLYLPEASIPGNLGMRDQVEALRWVRNNIASFGGDPDNVTIFGESAGGASVHLHVLSPMSKGLFHKAIAQSGSALCPWALCSRQEALERAQRLAERLGCQSKEPKQLVEFLRGVSAKQIVEASLALPTDYEKRTFLVAFFRPVSEEGANYDYEAFLPKDPQTLMSQAQFNHVPYMTGVTSNEGILVMPELLVNPSHAHSINEYFEDVLPCEIEAKKRKDVALTVKKFYFGNETFKYEFIENYAQYLSDIFFILGIQKTLDHLADHSREATYYYNFAFNGELNFYKKFLQATSLPGASHVDDLGYLFRMDLMDISIKSDSPTYKVLRKMLKLWTNFAKFGNPTPKQDDDIDCLWETYSKSDPAYLNIDATLASYKHLRAREISFWSNILSK